MDGIGAVRRVKAAHTQRLPAIAPQVQCEALSAPEPEQEASAARKPLKRGVPQLSTMQDVPEFWQTL